PLPRSPHHLSAPDVYQSRVGRPRTVGRTEFHRVAAPRLRRGVNGGQHHFVPAHEETGRGLRQGRARRLPRHECSTKSSYGCGPSRIERSKGDEQLMASKIAFFPVGNGDMTLIQLESGRTILIDVNIRAAADDPEDSTPDVAKMLR